MNLQEIKEFTLRERIKAYVYYGIEAEMEMIEDRIHEEGTNGEDRDYHRKQQKIFDNKIVYANKRIDDLQVLAGVKQ